MSSGPALPHLYTCAASSAREGAARAASRQRGLDAQLWLCSMLCSYWKKASKCDCWGKGTAAAISSPDADAAAAASSAPPPAAAAATVCDPAAARHALQLGGCPQLRQAWLETVPACARVLTMRWSLRTGTRCLILFQAIPAVRAGSPLLLAPVSGSVEVEAPWLFLPARRCCRARNTRF